VSDIKFQENAEAEIVCPFCGSKLIVKTNSLTGHQFLGCPNYPQCKHTKEIPEAWILKAQGQPELFKSKDETIEKEKK